MEMDDLNTYKWDTSSFIKLKPLTRATGDKLSPTESTQEDYMGTHTKAPWIIYDNYIASKDHVKNEDWDKAWICQWGSYTKKANAAHIVKCVNGWDEQQAKIDELVGALEKYQATVMGLTGLNEHTATSLLMAYAYSEAALTRAKGV